MSNDPFISYGQNREDVVLWRALSGVSGGRYVEVGANDPVNDSVTKAFHDRGWHGMLVEPDPAYAARLRAARERDIVVEAAVTTRGESVTLHLIADTGLSTLDDEVSRGHIGDGFASEDLTVRGARLDTLLAENGLDKEDVHFLLVDVEGAEADVLSSVDLTTWRPWVLVIEATAPRSNHPTHESWEPGVLAAGYQFCLFDGVSRFYVADERAGQLKASLTYPACVLDGYVGHGVTAMASHLREQDTLVAELRQEADHTSRRLTAETLRWRRAALVTWAGTARAVPPPDPEVPHLQALLADARADAAALRMTVSWKVTRPLRGVRRLTLRRGR